MKKKEIMITSILGEGSLCEGNFTANCSIRIDGHVKGSVKTTGALILGATGIVDEDIKAAAVVIGGEVYGNIEAPDKVELTPTAKVFGDITTNLIVIDEKAIFQGKCNMNREVPEKKEKVSARTVRSNRRSAKAAISEALKEIAEMEQETGDEKKAVENKTAENITTNTENAQ